MLTRLSSHTTNSMFGIADSWSDGIFHDHHGSLLVKKNFHQDQVWDFIERQRLQSNRTIAAASHQQIPSFVLFSRPNEPGCGVEGKKEKRFHESPAMTTPPTNIGAVSGHPFSRLRVILHPARKGHLTGTCIRGCPLFCYSATLRYETLSNILSLPRRRMVADRLCE